MPVKRRVAKHSAYPVTPEAVAAYRASDELALRRLWNLKPWQPSPIEAVGACPWSPGTAAANWWETAVDLRNELEAQNAG